MGGGEDQATGVRREKAADETVSIADEKGEEEGWGDGDGDDYSEEEYEVTDADEHEQDKAATEKGAAKNQPPGFEDSAEIDTTPDTGKEKLASNSSAEIDRGGKSEDGSRGAGDGAGRPGGQGINPAQNRESDGDFAAGKCSTNSGRGGCTISEVPGYLSGGEKVCALFPWGLSVPMSLALQ